MHTFKSRDSSACSVPEVELHTDFVGAWLLPNWEIVKFSNKAELLTQGSLLCQEPFPGTLQPTRCVWAGLGGAFSPPRLIQNILLINYFLIYYYLSFTHMSGFLRTGRFTLFYGLPSQNVLNDFVTSRI